LLFGTIHVAGAVEGAAGKTGQEMQQDRNAGKKQGKKREETEEG
jgi:hypothetical protein